MATKVWIPHPEEGYTEAQATGATKEEKNIKGTVKLKMFKCINAGGEVGLNPEQEKEVTEIEDDHYGCLPDVTTIRNVSNAAVLETLRGRYAKNAMYTFVDTIIVSCNPFQRLNLETAENMDKFAKCADVHSLEPHVYGISKWALDGCRGEKQNQAILISGESGAGKTEACKILLGFFADTAGSTSGVQDRIMQCNPILECLGNAKTSRNNNSSRFGKWTALYFDTKGGIAGAAVVDYLLEKSRVLAQSSLERDFHIFYMLLYADAAKYNLPGDAGKCGFLKSGSPKADGFDDKAEYAEVLHAFKDCTMPDDQVGQFMQIMAGVLLLGNIVFKDGGNDTSKIGEGGDAAAKGLQCDQGILEKACVSKKLIVGKDVTVKSLKPVDASNSRDGLATLIYARTFTWTIAFLNKVIAGSGDAASGVEIGLLDIAGFESFPFNTWEQITINLSNENLQQHFNDYIFKRELADYKAEGVPSDDIKFQDNQEILDTIADPKPTSIMTILDGESKGIPNDNAKADKKFIDNLTKAMTAQKNAYYTPDKFGKPEFTLLHYAGYVKYDVSRWVNEKNKDEPPPEAVDVLMTTTNPLLKEIATGIANEDAKTKKTVSQSFRASLKALIDKIRSAQPHFVRCIKPNDEKKPSIFTKKKVLEQLTYSGVMELVKIRRQGYPYRAPPGDFLKKFRCCLPGKLRAEAEKKAGKKLDSKSPDHGIMTQIMQGMADALEQPNLKIEYQMGKTKVMIRMKGLQLLEEKARYAKIGKAIIIQKMYRGHRVRYKMKRAIELKKVTSAFMKEHKLYQPDSAFSHFKGDMALLVKEAAKVQGWARECEGITFLKVASPDFVSMSKKLEKEAAVYGSSGDLRKTFDIMKLENAVAELTALKIEDKIVGELKDRLAKLTVQVPLANGMASLKMPLEPTDLASCKKAMLIVEAGDKHGLSDLSKWIDQDNGKSFQEVKKSWESVKGNVDKSKLDATQIQTEEQKIADARGVLEKAKAGGNEKEIKAAEDALRKLMLGGRKMTVTGQTNTETQKFIDQLDNAVATFDRGEIEKVVKICLENGVDANEIAEQREVMNKLRDPDYVAAQLGKTMKSLQGEKDEKKKTQLILACTNLMKAGADAGVDQELLDKADAAVKKCAAGGDGLGAADEAQLAMLELYGDFSKYPKINAAVVKAGYTDDGSKVNPMDKGGALTWSKNKLGGTLTQVSGDKSTNTALSAYRNILGWMTDHPVDEKRRAPLAYAIVWKARDQREELCTEMYAQVMKQISHNPGQRSRLLGWKLMVFMCKLAQPMPDFKPYIDAFLLRNELAYRGADDDHSREIYNVVHQCKECLANWGKEGGGEEDDGGGDADKGAELKLEVYTMASFDIHGEKKVKSPQVITVAGKATMKQLNKKAVEAIGVSTDTDHFGVHRADMDETPADEAGCAKFCKGNNIVLRKRMLRPKEKIQSNDMVFSDMIVGQAVQEFYWYQVPEEESRVAKVGAASAFFWRGDSGGADITEESVKTRLIPKDCLKNKSAADWAKLVQKAYDGDWKKCEDSPKLERISRILKAHQNLKGFASRQFPCVQKVGSKPEGLEGVSEIRVETITDLGASSMLIAITCTDVTLFDAKDGKELAKFGYGDSHRHKIKDWACVKNRVSLAMNIPQGDVYMVLESDKADDIVRFLDRAHDEENQGKRKHDAKKANKDDRDDRKKDRDEKKEKKGDDKKEKKGGSDKKDKKDDKKDKKKKGASWPSSDVVVERSP